MPSAGSPAQACRRCNAATERGPSAPSTGPDGKPCAASSNCSPATSHPTFPARIARLPNGCEPRRPSAARCAVRRPRPRAGRRAAALCAGRPRYAGRGCRRRRRGRCPWRAARPAARAVLARAVAAAGGATAHAPASSAASRERFVAVRRMPERLFAPPGVDHATGRGLAPESGAAASGRAGAGGQRDRAHRPREALVSPRTARARSVSQLVAGGLLLGDRRGGAERQRRRPQPAPA